MLQIDTIIWVVPGIAGLLVYNRFIKRHYKRLEGWQYLFTVVFFATPYYIISMVPPPPCFDGWSELSLELIKLLFSIISSVVLGGLACWFNNRVLKLSTLSTFHDCCLSWHKKHVFITLQNHKIYLGTLLDYTKDLGTEPTIEIIPLHSGYRSRDGTIHWIFEYPIMDEAVRRKMEGEGDVASMMIPYKEVVNFSLWSHSEAYTDAPQIKKPEI